MTAENIRQKIIEDIERHTSNYTNNESLIYPVLESLDADAINKEIVYKITNHDQFFGDDEDDLTRLVDIIRDDSAHCHYIPDYRLRECYVTGDIIQTITNILKHY